MVWFLSRNKSRNKSRREELLNEIKRSKTKKGEFIKWLEKHDLFFKKSVSWKELIDDLSHRRKPTNKELAEYIKDMRKTMSKVRTSSITPRHEKGHKFEKKVARWAKRYFNADDVKTNILVNGLSSKRPYEVDVHVIKGRFLRKDIWIECKNRKSSIKRVDVFKLLSAAKDIEGACKDGREDFYFDRLAIVSTSDFDLDALSYAEDNDVACFRYTNNKYELKNKVSWI